MSTALVSLSYSFAGVLNDATPEKVEEIQKLLPAGMVYREKVKTKKVDPSGGAPEEIVEVERWSVKTYEKFLLDGQQLTRLTELGVTFDLHSFKGTVPYTTGDGKAIGTLHVHLPNYDLNSFNEVSWAEDMCTEMLQKQLDQGWRILAVCPPKSQRRPDYIFGRYNKEKDQSNG